MSKKVVIGVITAVMLLSGIFWLVWKITFATARNAGDKDAPAITAPTDTIPAAEPPLAAIVVPRNIAIDAYFPFMDSLIARYDTLTPYPLSEYLLVRANAWIIDTLENTDYYRQMARGQFVYDQRKMTVLKAGDTLYLPGPATAAALLAHINATWLDVNIPAFRLRIMEGDSSLFSFPVRVGKNKSKFLAMAGRETDLRTHTGTGEIVRVNRQPVFYDPVTGKSFKYTKRDDGNTTFMPQIPWLEPAIDGRRYGQMIHPTTNPSTLEKTASNGCVGVREADAWRIYYSAPLGTKVTIRYDLVEVTEKGDTLRFRDVYEYRKGGRKYASLAFPLPKPPNLCWCLP